MIKISVITVCLNAARTLEQTVQSVLGQGYPNLEYIIVDGGSVDGTLDIIKKYESGLARFISEPDGGIYSAFNKGVGMASGEIIGILNADDFYAPWALEAAARAYLGSPDSDAFFGKTAVISETENSWRVYPLGRIKDITNRMSIPHPAVFLPKRTYDRWGKFDERYKIAGDWDYMLKMYLGGAAFCPVNEALTAFRFSGLSSVMSRKHIMETFTVYGRNLGWGPAVLKMAKRILKYYRNRALKAAGARNTHIPEPELTGNYTGDAALVWEEVRRKLN